MYKDPNRSRLREILSVIHKHNIARGVSPEKIRLILEDLGPTYIKLGQILSMRSDLLPKEICEELMHLQNEVTPMPFSEVQEVIKEAYGVALEEVFSKFEEEPIGSASIAQVHRATLRQTGEEVVVKVQRHGIYETMSRDIAFLHRALRVMPAVNMSGLVDMNKILDEMWMVAQEEMNFLIEAKNMEEFSHLNQDVAYVTSPKLYRDFTAPQVLVMEYIDGIPIDNKEALLEAGYDLNEIGTKMADNYVKQIMEDGFFHADPHPGNVCIRDGKIVWIDMGMMGRFSPHDQAQIQKAIRGVAVQDVSAVVEAVMSVGEFKDKPNQKQLYSDVNNWLIRYGNASFGTMNMGSVLQDLAEIMRENRMGMPASLTMLVRGLTTIEGVMAEIAPDISLIQVAAVRLAESRRENFDLKKALRENGKDLYQALHKGIKIPSYIADLLHSYTHGQTRINLDLHSTDDLNRTLYSVSRHLVTGVLIAALLISSSIICTTNMAPKILGIPVLGAVGYILAFVLTLAFVVRYLQSKKKKRR